LAEIESKKRAIEEALRNLQEQKKQMGKIRLDNLSQETEYFIGFRLTKEYIDTITAEGRKQLGEAYSGSDFSK
jgi:hypothetical protein